MQPVSQYSMDRLSQIAEVAPVIRGALARPGQFEGKPNRTILAFDEGTDDGAVTLRQQDMHEINNILSGDIHKVYVPELGVFTAGQTLAHANGKLGKDSQSAQWTAGELSGQVAVVTGGAGGLGLSIAEELCAQGAEIALLDIAESAVQTAAKKLDCIGFVCDVTNSRAVEMAIKQVVAHYGGVDILISNAGAAHQGALLDLDDDCFEKAFALNFWSHHFVARTVVKVMKRQKTGGSLVFNVSKQAVNPGPNFGAYGTSKAALMALMRQYAVEHGADGITSNAVNADRIRTGLMSDKMVKERSKARGITPEQYMRGNLVKREVTGRDVAEAFVHLAKARASTGSVLTVDGGNVAAMMR